MNKKRIKATAKHWCLKFGVSFAFMAYITPTEQWYEYFGRIPQCYAIVAIGVWTVVGVWCRWVQHERSKRWALFQSSTGLLFCLMGVYALSLHNFIISSFCLGLAWASDECGYLHAGFNHIKHTVHALHDPIGRHEVDKWSI